MRSDVWFLAVFTSARAGSTAEKTECIVPCFIPFGDNSFRAIQAECDPARLAWAM